MTTIVNVADPEPTLPATSFAVALSVWSPSANVYAGPETSAHVVESTPEPGDGSLAEQWTETVWSTVYVRRTGVRHDRRRRVELERLGNGARSGDDRAGRRRRDRDAARLAVRAVGRDRLVDAAVLRRRLGRRTVGKPDQASVTGLVYQPFCAVRARPA